MLLGLKVLGPEELPPPVGRPPTIGTGRPACRLPVAIVLRPVEGQSAVAWPGGAARRLASMETVAAVAIAGAKSLPVPVSVQGQLMVEVEKA